MKRLLLITGFEKVTINLATMCVKKFSQQDVVEIDHVTFDVFSSMNGDINSYDGVIVTEFLSYNTNLPRLKYVGNATIKRLVEINFSGKIFVSVVGDQLFQADLENNNELGGLIVPVLQIKEIYSSDVSRIVKLITAGENS